MTLDGKPEWVEEIAKAYVDAAEANLVNAGTMAAQADAVLDQAVQIASQQVPDTIDAWNAVIPPNADIAKACGVGGVQVTTPDELTETLKAAVKAQMEEGKTTFIEVLTNQELGEPFRRDAMKKPVVVAGIDKADMRPQKGA